VVVRGLAVDTAFEGKTLAVIHAVAAADVSASVDRTVLGMWSDYARMIQADALLQNGP
jgi:hypothetical protein